MYVSKKIILGVVLGAFVPVSLLIPSSKTYTKYKIFVNYNGQADLLLSLQIFPDYYPYQFKQQKLYDYLTHSQNFIINNTSTSSEKTEIYNKFQSRLNNLVSEITDFGPSLWNKDLYDTGLVFRNDQFWTKKHAEYLFIEQFIADDFLNMADAINFLPKHNKLIVTNYRVARDPYTIFGKDTFEYFKSRKNNTNPTTSSTNNNFNKKFYDWYINFDQANINSLFRFAKYIEFWNENIDLSDENNTDKNHYSKLIDESEKLFFLENAPSDTTLSHLYTSNVFSDEEIDLLNSWMPQQNGQTTEWKMNYKNNKTAGKAPTTKVTNLHHPSLEHAPIKGTAPLAEGSQKEVMVYLYQFAQILDKISKSSDFANIFKGDKRKEFIEKAKFNASHIFSNYQERIKNIRDYFKEIKVVDSSFDPDNNVHTTNSSKSLAIITYPPNSVGGGSATIQTISKFPFIYRDLGFKQIIPQTISNYTKNNPSQVSLTSNLNKQLHEDTEHGHDLEHGLEKIFSVDDNGWWWNIGNTNIFKNNLDEFKDTADSIILLSTQDDWNILNGSNSEKLNAFYSVLKSEVKNTINKFDYKKINKTGYPFSYSRYNLWNEGLRSPIAVNLLLDNLIEIIKNQYANQNQNSNIDKYKKALDWGNYWNEHFIKGTSANSLATIKTDAKQTK